MVGGLAALQNDGLVDHHAEDDGPSLRVRGVGMVFGTPKNGKARDVAVSRLLLDMLKETIKGKGPDALVFAAHRGGPMRLRNVRRD
ncbi:hypothetical protein ACW9HQ_30865 [Nocardia gipuzkoensis]